MADICDTASDAQDIFLQQSLAKQRATSVAQKSSPNCLFCEEPITEGRFCDSDCRDDYQRLEFARSQKIRE